MTNENTNTRNKETADISAQSRAAVLPPIIIPDDFENIGYSIDTYTVNSGTNAVTTGTKATCNSNNFITCNITISPNDNSKFKAIKRALLVLKNYSGSTEGFAVYYSPTNGVLQGEPFAYMDNRYDSNGNITHRVIDISTMINNAEAKTVPIAIKSISGASCTVYTSEESIEFELIEDDDFISNVSKLERNVGGKGAYSVNTRNGKLFYTQKLITAKGGRMPLNLSMTYNAKDCDTSSPNGISTGIKGWTFNYGQTLDTTNTNYILLDGTHKYRTFKPSVNNSAIKYDASGKNGVYLTEDSTGYTVTDGKNMTYKFDASKRLTEIKSVVGSTPITTEIAYDSNGRISEITDGMGDVYRFAYGTNAVTVSRGDTELVKITLTNERVTQVKYLLSNEAYTYTYNTNGKLLTVTETASDEKAAFEYNGVHSVNAIKNYIYKDSVSSPTDCYFLNYEVLTTRVKKCRNHVSQYSPYATTVYMFAENGETIFVAEDGTSGAFKNMRFRDKNDYEKYVADVISASDAATRSNAGKFLFDSQDSHEYSTGNLAGNLNASSNTLSFNTFDFPSKNFIFTAKVCIEASSCSTSDNSQSINLVLKEGSTVIKTLKFDPQIRNYQVKSAMIYLTRGDHSLTAELQINNMHATVKLSDVLIFETNKANHTEYITVFADSFGEVENDGETNWYINRGGLTLTSGSVQKTGVKYTAKDYILTTISRLKNPSSFNVWYNDGENMLAGVSSAYLIKNGVTQSIASIKCCTLTRQMGKIIFSTVQPSALDGGLIKAVNITKMQKEVEDEDGNTTLEDEFFTSTVDYNSYMKPVEATNEDGVVTQYTYNAFGEVLTEKIFPISNTALNTLVSKTYSNGNLASITEKRGVSTYTRTFEYTSDNLLSNEITPNGQYIYRTYTSDREKLAQISATVSGDDNMNDITYTGDLITAFSHNETLITFEYDERNMVNNVKVAGASILSKEITHSPANKTQTLTTYGNGMKIKKYYDEYNRLIQVTEVADDETETQLCAYIYSDAEVDDTITSPEDGTLSISSASKLRAYIDDAAGTRTNFIYDEYGDLKERQTGNTRESILNRDMCNRPTEVEWHRMTDTLKNIYEYENDYSSRVKFERLYIGARNTDVSYTRDALKRISEIKTVQDGIGYKRKFAYLVRGNVVLPEGTTNYVGSISYYNVVNDASTLEKTESIAYNSDGNIVTYGENTYDYDRIGRLVRENNKILDKTFLFCYNEGGNIVSKTEYAYTTGAVGTAIKTYNYTYGNAWKDQLTGYGGTAITYDAAGNPTSYLGKTLTWSRGRLLTKYVSGSKTVDMQYDANGLRIAKSRKISSNTLNSTYIYDSQGKLRTEIAGNTTRTYIYGQDGIVGYEESGVHFMYRKNFFGDITAIYQGTTKIAEYSYDAWGNCTIVSDYNGYGARNPFRYRGYYFDTDLNMYYLMTRYYDPQTGRFINADTPKYLKPKTINGLNLYAYCGDNPIMYVDPTGHDFWSDLWNFIIELFAMNSEIEQRNAAMQHEVIKAEVEIASEVVGFCYDAYMQSYQQEVQNQLMMAQYRDEATILVIIGISTPIVAGTEEYIKSKGKPITTNGTETMGEGLVEFVVNYLTKDVHSDGSVVSTGTSGAAGGGGLFDPLLYKILNESFTGEFN